MFERNSCHRIVVRLPLDENNNRKNGAVTNIRS